MFALFGVLALITVFDIVIHVATDQVEPLRIAGNVIVLVASLGILAIPAVRRAWVPAAAGLWNLVLNVIHVTNEGIGTLGVVLIAATTVLCIVLTVQLARHTPSRL
jgi:hypothetical protein